MSAALDTLATEVYRRLRADILTGRRPPGQRLKVQDLTSAMEVGASPVREALAQLTAEGLAVRLEQRGFRVAAAEAGDVPGLVRSRVLAETAALREALLCGGAEWEEGVVLAEYRLAPLPRSLPDAPHLPNPDWEAAHDRFHHALLAGCDARPLLDFCARLREEAARYRAAAHATAHPVRNVAAEHAALAQATLQRNADLACSLLAAHYERTGTYLRAGLGG